MKIKIFWKKNCPYCPEAKNIGEKMEKETEVEYFDVDTVDGLAEASYYSIAATPSIIVLDTNGHEIKAWRGKTPSLEEIRRDMII